MFVFASTVNTGQACFEAMAHVVRRVQSVPDAKCDQHNRNSLLTQYVEYMCTLPHHDATALGKYTRTVHR